MSNRDDAESRYIKQKVILAKQKELLRRLIFYAHIHSLFFYCFLFVLSKTCLTAYESYSK